MVCKALASLDEPIIDDLSQLEISIHKALASLDEDSGNSSSGEGISIHKALASLDTHICTDGLVSSISIHKALASLDFNRRLVLVNPVNFNPQGSREPRQQIRPHTFRVMNFNPQGSREPRQKHFMNRNHFGNFNPQGSREPRLNRTRRIGTQSRFQSTRLSRASTKETAIFKDMYNISIHKALASLDALLSVP